MLGLLWNAIAEILDPEPRAPVKVTAISIKGRHALLSNGRTVPIVKLYDFEGDETDEPEDAVRFAAGAVGEGWYGGDTRDYARQTRH